MRNLYIPFTMKDKLFTHYCELQSLLKQNKAPTSRGIPTSTIPYIMERTDSDNVFIEGDLFSKNIKGRNSEVSLTLCSSPHFHPSIPLNEFIEQTSRIISDTPSLPKSILNTKLLPPHLLLWWRTNLKSHTGITEIFQLSDGVRNEVLQNISLQAYKAFRILSKSAGKRVLYGTWGYATEEERAVNGLSRGGPSNPNGHCHIAVVNSNDQQINYLQTPSTAQRLKFLAPWNRLLNQHLYNPITRIIERTLTPYDQKNSVQFMKKKFINRLLSRILSD